jgi:hypothetical protein
MPHDKVNKNVCSKVITLLNLSYCKMCSKSTLAIRTCAWSYIVKMFHTNGHHIIDDAHQTVKHYMRTPSRH